MVLLGNLHFYDEAVSNAVCAVEVKSMKGGVKEIKVYSPKLEGNIEK